MSCKNCCRATAADYEVVFTCNSCKEKHPAIPRCRFDVDLTDSTGVIPASVFGELAEKLLTFNGLEAMQHFDQNVELPLEFVHNELKSKMFLLHIKPVQTQLADARQRYTIIYYSEIDDPTASIQLTSQTEDDSSFLGKEVDNVRLGTPGGDSDRSKICVRLSDRFDEPQNVELDVDENAECSSSKKQKLI
nr:uncharacterized protein LOC113722603 [Coffea arabica]